MITTQLLVRTIYLGQTCQTNSSVVTRDLSQAFKKDVKILLEQSPMNAVKTQPSIGRNPLTGPVYLIIKPHKDVELTADSGGSHPLLSSYDSKASQLAAPWVFAKCLHTDADRFFGGIHFFELRFATKGRDMARAPIFEIAVIWGMHGDKDEVNRELDQDPTATPWKPWCRVFDMRLFMNRARTSTEDLQPHQLYGKKGALSAGEIQRRMEGQRKRLCLQGYSSAWLHSAKGPRRLIPDSYDEEWSQDIFPAVVEDENHIIDLITKVERVEGLGRVLYELQVKIEVADKDGWSPEMSEAECADFEKKEVDALLGAAERKELKILGFWNNPSLPEQIEAIRREMRHMEVGIGEKWRVRNRHRKDA